jgi:Predicted transcriptional regulator with C-terminal CBS domains
MCYRLGMIAPEMLKMARRRAGVTQRELARRSGVPQPTISRIEAARMSPTLDTLVPLMGACGMELTLIDSPGAGVDRSLIRARLGMSPAERLRQARQEWAGTEPFRRAARAS